MTKTCPVLAYTPDVERVRFWFPWCYELQVVGMGAPVLRLARLPGAGALADQEAWLMEALAVMASEQQTIHARHDERSH